MSATYVVARMRRLSRANCICCTGSDSLMIRPRGLRVASRRRDLRAAATTPTRSPSSPAFGSPPNYLPGRSPTPDSCISCAGPSTFPYGSGRSNFPTPLDLRYLGSSPTRNQAWGSSTCATSLDRGYFTRSPLLLRAPNSRSSKPASGLMWTGTQIHSCFLLASKITSWGPTTSTVVFTTRRRQASPISMKPKGRASSQLIDSTMTIQTSLKTVSG